ncbi:MAG: hypothetical protein J6W67_02670, partial [Lentisphaeria bacterium]|nr:hypothetical protein [Lentisphaeria bacterium]
VSNFLGEHQNFLFRKKKFPLSPQAPLSPSRKTFLWCRALPLGGLNRGAAVSFPLWHSFMFGAKNTPLFLKRVGVWGRGKTLFP